MAGRRVDILCPSLRRPCFSGAFVARLLWAGENPSPSPRRTRPRAWPEHARPSIVFCDCRPFQQSARPDCPSEMLLFTGSEGPVYAHARPEGMPMPEVTSGGVRISYDVVGEGRPLMLLHGWCCDRSWWTEPGYVDELKSDIASSTSISAATARATSRTKALPTAGCHDRRRVRGRRRRGLDRFAIWGQSAADGSPGWRRPPPRSGSPAIVASGAWDPRPEPEEPTETDEWAEALRHGGTSALVDRFKIEMGETFDREFPPGRRP